MEKGSKRHLSRYNCSPRKASQLCRFLPLRYGAYTYTSQGTNKNNHETHTNVTITSSNLKVPTTIEACESLQLDATSAKGGGGKPLFYDWEILDPANPTVIQKREYKLIRRKLQSLARLFSPLVTVTADLLRPGNTHRTNLTRLASPNTEQSTTTKREKTSTSTRITV